MFDVGISELALIAVLALIIAGPERLPGIMRTLGRFAGRAKATFAAVRTELEREVERTERAAEDRRTHDKRADDDGGREP